MSPARPQKDTQKRSNMEIIIVLQQQHNIQRQSEV